MTQWLVFFSAVAGSGITLLGSLIVARIGAKSERVTASAATQNAINAGFQALTNGFHEELGLARGEIVELRGWIRDLIQHIDSLEGLLRAHGIDVPLRTRPHPIAKIAGPGGS